jgi:hypothetical protein
MTMPTDVASPPRQSYVENGVTTVHPIPFKFVDAADISVVRILANGTRIPLVQPADYTVQGGGYDVGQITKATGGVAAATITIDRNTPRSQLVDLLAGDAFPEESQDHAFDRLTMIVQELARDSITAAMLPDILAATLVQGAGIQIVRAGAKFTIVCTVDGIDKLADCLLLSGDQQGGGSGSTGGVSLAEQVRDIIGLALEGTGAVSVTANDAGDVITIDVPTSTILTAEDVRDIIGAALIGTGAINVTPNDAGDVITISTTALDASYEGIVPTGHAANFDFADNMNGRGTLWTGGAGIATIRLEADVPLPDGWTHRIRNTGGGNLQIKRVTAGVNLFKNGATVSADAILAPGGTVTLERWAANDFTITGTKLS